MNAAAGSQHAAWYRQPTLWLGLFVFIASLAGCVLMIVLAEQYHDPASPELGVQIMKVPLTRHPASPATQ